MGDAYPYPVKALFLYMGAPVYSLPAGHKLSISCRDPKKTAAVHRHRHRGRRDQHVRRLHLPGPHLSGALGVPGIAPIGHPKGGPVPPAGVRPAHRDRDGLRRADAAHLWKP